MFNDIDHSGRSNMAEVMSMVDFDFSSSSFILFSKVSITD